MNPIQNIINTLLSEKYGEELIKNSYNYYQENIVRKIGPLLNSISDKWIETYDILIREINNNIDNFKNSKNEFFYMAQIYLDSIKNNITKNYFNSIVNHQKNEFNSIITYYYNKLLKLIKSSHQYIINKIPNNRVGYNNLLNMRKNEINEVYLNLIDIIEKSEANSLDEKQQINILQIQKTNFFKINEVLSNNILETDESLQSKVFEIDKIHFSKSNDEFSLSSRFYLENQQSKMQIDELYDHYNTKNFIVLNIREFKDTLIDNWILNQDNLINEINNSLYNSNLEIEKELSFQKNYYREQLEEYITKSFTKEILINKINDLWKNPIQDLTDNQIKEIENNIQGILNKIKKYIIDESYTIKYTSISYIKNFKRIKQRINSLKIEIFNKLNETLFSVLDSFYQKMIIKVYEEYVLAHINDCISVTKKYTETYEKYSLLNSSYKIGEIIEDIIGDILVEIKNISKNQINYLYNKRYNEIRTKIGIINLERIINDQLDQEFNSKLLPVLENISKVEERVIMGYIEYDFNNSILASINSLIEINMNKIKNIINFSKGTNYDINIDSWERNCSSIFIKVEEINTSLKTFMNNEKSNEEDNFDKLLQNIIKNNFNNLLNSIFPSFGSNFIKRIIKYNENFKISSLYDSLTYSLKQTISYYLLLYNNSQFRALTKDLKEKLFSLNNIDSTVQKKNNEILNFLEEEVNKFIIDFKEYLIDKYKSYLEDDIFE